MSDRQVVFVMFLMVLVFMWLSYNSEDELAQIESQYCEMVELNQSDPTLGWPDYQNIYSEMCK